MGQEDNVHRAVSSLRELASLETETLAAEINLLGVLRDRISPAARYGDQVPIKFRKLRQKMDNESEQIACLSDGFPFTETGKALTALLVIDKYSTVEIQPGQPGGEGSGQYVGERLYLTPDRKWILAERMGAYTHEPGATNEWDASCRIVSDRSLLEKFSLDAISEGLFAATNRVWEKLSPRMEALKRRFDKVGEVSSALSRLKAFPQQGVEAPGPELRGRTQATGPPLKRTISEP